MKEYELDIKEYEKLIEELLKISNNKKGKFQRKELIINLFKSKKYNEKEKKAFNTGFALRGILEEEDLPGGVEE